MAIYQDHPNLVDWSSLMIIHRRFALTILLLVASTAPAISYSQLSSDPEQRVKIRTEYNRTQATPDHLIFAYTLLYVRNWHKDDADIARQIVSARMELESEESADKFLESMLDAADELENKRAVVTKAMLCVGRAYRTEKLTYVQMDGLDDAKENLSLSIYRGFMSNLDDRQSSTFSAWLSKMKQGYYYRTAEHEGMYKDTGYAVTSHIDNVCAQLEASR
jgi:hypothetical protein